MEEARLWQAALNKANVVLFQGHLLSFTNLATHQPVLTPVVHPHSNFGLLSNKPCTHGLCIASGLKATHWRKRREGRMNI